MKTIRQTICENMEYNQRERIKDVLGQIENYLEKIADEMESHATNITEFLHGVERLTHTVETLLKDGELYLLDANTWMVNPCDLQRVLGYYEEIPVAEEFYGMSANNLRWRTDGDKLQADAVRLCDEGKGHYEFVTLLNNDRTVWRKPYVPV